MSYSHQKGLTRLHILFITLVTVVVLFVVLPLVLPRRTDRAPLTEALNNAKAIAGGLITFKVDKGYYPSDATRQTLEAEGITNLPPGKDANAYLAQLIVTEIIDSETYFFASGVKGAIKGDDIIGTPEKLLSYGENGFAYVMTPNGKPLTDVTSDTPLVLAPTLTGGSNPTFDPNPYAEQLVYGAADGSGKIATINKHRQALTKDGTPLFATGPGTFFKTETPIVILPTKTK
ncbi:MAG: hypothetical protein ACJAQT_000253 [Akkermansiaceae bacterium]|jgi:hypothetical protein